MSHAAAASPAANGRLAFLTSVRQVLPGIALTAALAGVATGLRHIPGLEHFSPLIIAIVLGALVHNLLGSPAVAIAGIGFTLRTLLRLGVVLLGLQLTVQNLIQVGPAGLAVIVITLTVTFVATKLLGRALGVERRLAELIAAGTAVCGASAVIATNTVAKLARVAMLAPLVLILALRPRPADAGQRKRMQFPLFVLGFVAMIGLNSMVASPAEARAVLAPATAWLLTMALAAMGRCTDVRRLHAKGLRPLALAAAAWAVVALTSLTLVKAFT